MGLRPTQDNENASVRHPLSMEPLPFPCHPDRSEAERRDLRFRGPFLGDVFSTERSVAEGSAVSLDPQPMLSYNVASVGVE
jgi:hypothetical protein